MADDPTLALRFTAVGLALALMLAGLVGLPRRAQFALLPLLACLASYLLRSAPQARGWPVGLLLPLSLGALLFPLAFWWLVRSAFDDRVDVPWPAWAAAAVMVAAGLLSRPAGAEVSLSGDGPHALQKAIAVGFVAAGLWRLWRSGAQDLVAGRRRLRGWLLAYIGAHGLAILAVELWLRGARAPLWLDAWNVAAIGLALAVALILMLGFRTTAVETLFGEEPRDAPGGGGEAPAAPAEAAPAGIAVDDEALWLERLDVLMRRERVYREPELSVAGLAMRLGLPEYRLRELINRRLGFRNFPAFVNAHRLREVELRLADPACDRRPILTLALEAGFGSIGPFNRAFRERHGMSPTAFRSRRGALAA
ncbi:helix-turn-helix domain-containing protein [Variovorax sp. LARHSF232]